MEDYPPVDLGHLQPSAQTGARLPDAERVQRIRADRWIGYPRAVEAVDRLETLYEWPTKQRMSNLLLVGPTNNGKSMIIEKFRRQHAASSGPDREQIPVLGVQMPSEPSVSRFYVALLAAMGAPIRPRQRVAELEQLALSVLRRVGVRMLIIDELHNVLAGGDGSRREFLNLLRFLGNELRIPLGGVGTREAYLAIHADSQLENRFEPFTLPCGRRATRRRRCRSPDKPSTVTSPPTGNSDPTANDSSPPARHGGPQPGHGERLDVRPTDERRTLLRSGSGYAGRSTPWGYYR